MGLKRRPDIVYLEVAEVQATMGNSERRKHSKSGNGQVNFVVDGCLVQFGKLFICLNSSLEMGKSTFRLMVVWSSLE
jgi:hypothetical protein